MPDESIVEQPLAISNTGPLISILQSDSMDLVVTLFGNLHTSEACITELIGHGWEESLAQANGIIVRHKLTEEEAAQAQEIARRIAAHSFSNDTVFEHHLGEAEVMVLAGRPEYSGCIMLLDERAARAVAAELDLKVSGFAGILLLAASEKLLTADEVKNKLKQCQQLGTHYGDVFVQQVYQAAKEGNNEGEKRNGT